MSPTQRHELYLALMKMSAAVPEDYKELAEMTVEEVERIEPVIDDMLKLAFDQGKVASLLEIWARHKERWHALKSDAEMTF
jgi:hypothetical protein